MTTSTRHCIFTLPRDASEKCRLQELRISIKSLKIGRKTRRDFTVIVRYQPELDADGNPVLKRDGVISLLGCPRVSDQIPLRAAFGLIFPEARAENADGTTGVRVSDGRPLPHRKRLVRRGAGRQRRPERPASSCRHGENEDAMTLR